MSIKTISGRKLSTLVISLVITFIAGCTAGTLSVQPFYPYDTNKLYQDSIIDSVIIEQNEIMPVAVITPESDNITWDRVNNRYLVMTFNKFPNSYPAGQGATLSWGSVWVFCDKEMKKWYSENSIGVTDWTLRLNQLLGLPPTSGYTHVSGFWVSPNDIIRPAYVNDITKSEMVASFDETVAPAYRQWFNDNIIRSYFEGESYPWTRIGYTFDWAPNGKEKGLSEFLIRKGATVHVEFTEPLEQFIQRLK